MKIRWIYSEQGNSIEDMSKDRVHLNLSFNEWTKIREFISESSWLTIADEVQIKKLQKKARNLRNMIDHKEEQQPIWLDENGRAK